MSTWSHGPMVMEDQRTSVSQCKALTVISKVNMKVNMKTFQLAVTLVMLHLPNFRVPSAKVLRNHPNVLRAQLKVVKIANFYKVSPESRKRMSTRIGGLQSKGGYCCSCKPVCHHSDSHLLHRKRDTVWSCFDVHMDQEMWSCFNAHMDQMKESALLTKPGDYLSLLLQPQPLCLPQV